MKILYALIIISLIACTPTRVEPPGKLTLPEHWQHQHDVKAALYTKELKNWWQGFKDPLLNQLIQSAIKANPDLNIVRQRLREAKAMSNIAESRLYPTIEFAAFGGRMKSLSEVLPRPTPTGLELFIPTADIISGGLSARWEIDLFGGKTLAAEAAEYQAKSMEDQQGAIQTGLNANIASLYFEWRGLLAREKILQDSIHLQQERLRALKGFFAAGLSNQANIDNQEVLAHKLEVLSAQLNAQASSFVHRLSVLAGELPTALEQQLTAAPPVAWALPALPAAIPSELLEQRPDLRSAKNQLYAAAANLGSARTELLPKLIFSINGGYGALATNGFSSLAESLYVLGSGLSAPIFNAGRIQSFITAQDAKLEQAAINYEKTFLTAAEDVENAYVAYSAAVKQQQQLQQAQNQLDKTYADSRQLYQQGAVDYLTLLDSQSQQLVITDELSKVQTTMQVQLISLYRAFGGGLENTYRQKEN